MKTVLSGDWREEAKRLADGSVHCCITSPPYWRLRSYLPKEHPRKSREIGQEATLELFIASMVEVFREVWRVLREDGTVWLNLGDCYASTSGCSPQSGLKALSDIYSPRKNPRVNHRYQDKGHVVRRPVPSGLKPKDLVGIPWRVALALQAEGWYLRQDIIWHKPNPMPESVTDRPTKSHEYVFLLTKSERYYYDAEAIKEKVTGTANPRGRGTTPKARLNGGDRAGNGRQNESFSTAVKGLVRNRNRRSVWSISSRPYKGAHFATFPPDLVRPCLRAGTSEGGCCADCGSPLVRVLEKGKPNLAQQRACGGDVNGEYHGTARKLFELNGVQNASAVKARILAGMVEKKTVGWRRTCRCETTATMPCVVLDPFGGSGTVGMVAEQEGRDAVLCELNPDYLPLIDQRCAVTPPLPLTA